MKKTKAVLKKDVKQSEVNEYLLFLFSRMDYTESKARTKLKERYPHQPEMHDIAIARMIELDYLNESRYASRFVEALFNSNLGISKIKQKMYTKGFDRDIAASAVENFFEEIDNQKEQARVWREKWYGKEKITDHKEYQRATRRLVSKGFSFSDVRYVIQLDYIDDDL